MKKVNLTVTNSAGKKCGCYTYLMPLYSCGGNGCKITILPTYIRKEELKKAA